MSAFLILNSALILFRCACLLHRCLYSREAPKLYTGLERGSSGAEHDALTAAPFHTRPETQPVLITHALFNTNSNTLALAVELLIVYNYCIILYHMTRMQKVHVFPIGKADDCFMYDTAPENSHKDVLVLVTLGLYCSVVEIIPSTFMLHRRGRIPECGMPSVERDRNTMISTFRTLPFPSPCVVPCY